MTAMPADDFTGPIPDLYERYLVPLIFEPYATVLAPRLTSVAPLSRVLEIAAGTGVLTRALAAQLPAAVEITATDLSAHMLRRAAAVGTSRPVVWRQADAMELPFADGTFDVAACQFGAMFFRDKARAFAEARRVIRQGGVYIFTVWDRIGENDFADAVTDALAAVFPHDPPRFLRRVPHGYFDGGVIAHDLIDAGFSASAITMTTVAARSWAATPEAVALAYCQGTPLRTEIEARVAVGLTAATAAATAAIADRFGPGPVDGKIQAHVVTAIR